LNRGGGCGGAIVAFTVAALAVWAVEKLWPYLLATVLLAAGLAAARAATRHPVPVPLDASKATRRDTREARMTDAERDQVERALRDAAADGRIDRDELEERLARAYRAKRWGEIKPLIEDLGL
jgi:CBS-domain-containing membrane protein